ncbi:hypothetical protein pipiens_002999 [Culex pipiens pipiens]|uniref:Uncharacterized protein n=1 Tax=Culex pipiens pipiens TaxID=38569 RepID=A0ABD1D8A5_CULPP
MEIRLHNEGCLMATEHNFVAQVRIEDSALLDGAAVDQQALDFTMSKFKASSAASTAATRHPLYRQFYGAGGGGGGGPDESPPYEKNHEEQELRAACYDLHAQLQVLFCGVQSAADSRFDEFDGCGRASDEHKGSIHTFKFREITLYNIQREHWKAVRSGSRRDLSRAVTLLEIIERREKINREQLHLRIGVYEKRSRVSVGRRRKFVGRDGSVLPGACDRYHHQYHLAGGSAGGQPLIRERGRIDPRAIAVTARFHGSGTAGDPALTSDKEELVNLEGATAPEEEYAYTVQPRKFSVWNWPWVSNEENGGQLLGHYAQHCIMTYLPTTTTESGVLRPFCFNGLGVRVSNTR